MRFIDRVTLLLVQATLLATLFAGCGQKESEQGFTTDLRETTKVLELDSMRYVDPKGFFMIIPPRGWRLEEYPQDPRGKAAFYGDDATLRILVNLVEFSTFEELKDELRSIQERTGFSIEMEEMDFYGIPATKRSYTQSGMKFFWIDFLEGNVAHNIQYSSADHTFHDYLPMILKSMETYEAITQKVTGDDVIGSIVAKKVRLAQLMLEMGSADLALTIVEEGLSISPHDSTLLQLKNRLADGQ